MRIDEFDLPMSDGVPVHVYRWRPDDRPRAVVQISHGMVEHGARYARLAADLVADGYAAWVHDHRGHGRTARSDDDLGFFADEDGFERVTADLLTVRAEIGGQGKEGAELPVALFAHSMGSFITQSALVLHPPSPWRAVIMAGSDTPGGLPISALRQAASVERRRQGARGRSPVIDGLAFRPYNVAFRPTRTGSDWLSRDAAEVDTFIADPRTGFRFTNQAWVDFLGGREQVARVGFGSVSPSDLPILLLSGDRDPVGRTGVGVPALFDQLRSGGLTDVRMILYPGARHELVNETNRAQVTTDILAFLDETVG